MARSLNTSRRGLRGFVILIVIVIIGGAVLYAQGDLQSPLQSTTLLLSMASGEESFAMAGDRPAPPDSETSSTTETSSDLAAASAETADTASAAGVSVETTVETESIAAPESASAQTTTSGMTLDELTAQLAAAGVDVEAVSAEMSAEGRSLENLLSVVNSGRVTVADLAARLNGETAAEAQTPPSEGSISLIDFRWDELGSVAYNLWVMLAATLAVIIAARPASWVINRVKRAPAAASASRSAS